MMVYVIASLSLVVASVMLEVALAGYHNCGSYWRRFILVATDPVSVAL